MKLIYKLGDLVEVKPQPINHPTKAFQRAHHKKGVVVANQGGFEELLFGENIYLIKVFVFGEPKPSYYLSDRLQKLC